MLLNISTPSSTKSEWPLMRKPKLPLTVEYDVAWIVVMRWYESWIELKRT